MNNYSTHRDARNSSYRRYEKSDASRHNSTHNKSLAGFGRDKERESDKYRERERLERKRDSSWRYERAAKVECRDTQISHHYQKYTDESYHHYSRQSHGYYYNHHHENYARSRHAPEDFYKQASTSSSSKDRAHIEAAYEVDVAKEESMRAERNKRHKVQLQHASEAEITDEQTEHDLRSRLLSKRNKFMKGHDEAPHVEKDNKEAKSSQRLDGKQHLSDHILELKRERLMLRSLLKSTLSDSSGREEEKIKEREHNKRNSVRAHKTNVLSPSAVAASVTAGLKDLTGINVSSSKSKKNNIQKINTNNNICTYALDSETEQELDLLTDESEATNSRHSKEDDFEGSSSKMKKLKKKKKKKKKKRHHNESDTDILAEDEQQQQLNEKTTVVVRDSSESESEHYRKRVAQLSPAAVSISTDRSSSETTNSTNSPHKHRRKKSLSRGSSMETISDASKSAASLPSSRDSSCSRSRSRSRTRTDSRRRSYSRSSSRSRSLSTGSERSISSHSSRNDATKKRALAHSQKSKNTEEQVAKLDKSENNGSEVILEEEDLNLPNYYPGVQGCRSVEEFQCLNRIEEGTYGVVYRAKDKRTNEIVALKRLKMEKEKEGFPITSLREINTLLKGQHPNIVHVREIVVGSNMDKIFIVMDYVEHDLKSLMETMKQRKQKFLPSEVKCLVQQLLRAVAHLHDNWILHRDLKTSNLLLSHKGILKVGDFGLAREYGSPLKRYTLLVVTLWYRAPELLLCAPEYSTPIDMWSVGCIFAELLLMKPLFNGESEKDQLNRIFKELGTPDEVTWPGFKELPAYKNILTQNSQFMDYKICNLKKRFAESLSDLGMELLEGMLTCDPHKRLTAEAALRSPYFTELPLPIDPSMFPTWPAKSELGARKSAPSPRPPSGGNAARFPSALNTNSSVKSAASAKIIAAGNARILSSIITGSKKSAANTGFVLNAGLEQRRLDLIRNLNKK